MAYLTTQEQIELSEIFLCQKVPPKAVKPMVEQLAHWEAAHGIKWLVSRLKAMRACLLSGKADPSIRTHSDGSFYGPFRVVSHLSRRGRRGSILADRILRVYGRWEHGKISKEDFLTFAKSVEVEPVYADLPVSAPKELGLHAKRASRQARFNLDLPISKRKRVPFIGKFEFDTHPLEHLAVLLQQCPNLYRKHQSFFDRYIYKNEAELFDEFASSIDFGSFWDEPTITFDVVGKIAGLTKDRGLKKRFIANPHRFLQMATSRLQDAADRVLRNLEVSLVHNQGSSEPWIVGKLNEGVRLFSLDLSSATDNFPMWYQLRVARQLFPELTEDIDLWADICSCLWELPFPYEKSFSPEGQVLFDNEVRYTRGQPMGTSPSFAIFTLSHIVMVYSLGGRSDDFRVIGDDIVIADPGLAERYQDAMARVGVTISLSKSLLDSTRAEFAGRIVDKFGFWPSYKSSPISVQRDPFGAFRQYGHAGAVLIKNPSDRELLSQLAKVPHLGPRHCWDSTVLESIDDSVILEIFKESVTPVPGFRTRPVDLLQGGLTEGHPNLLDSAVSAQKAFSLFEEAQSVSTGFLGEIGKNSNVPPTLIQHINSSLMSGEFEKSSLIRRWAAELERGVDLLSDREPTIPYAFLRRIGRLLKRCETAPVD